MRLFERRKWIRALGRASLGLSVLGACVLAWAQPMALPELGDPAAVDLAPAEERRLGEVIMGRLRRSPLWWDDAEMVDYLQQVAAPLQALPQTAGWSFSWFAIDDPTMNAMALPGGWMGVHRGVVTAAESESELAAVMAHEMSHVMLRHGARIMGQQQQASVAMVASLVLAAVAARSNPQAAWGSAMMGAHVAQGHVLAFSREAEREADRLGWVLLREAGFDPQAMVRFFGRLQHAQRFISAAGPTYARTHPLTSERMADIAWRAPATDAAPRPDSPDFVLLRARLRATADDTAAARQRARALAEQAVKTQPDAAAWFGLASVAAAQGDDARAVTALAQAEAAWGQGHRYFAALAVQLQRPHDPIGAAQHAAQALQRWPQARALARLELESWLAAEQPPSALERARQHLKTWPDDAQLWALHARAQQQLGQRALAHQAMAQSYVLLGAPSAAIDQLRLALAAGDADFVTSSMIDARMRELAPAARRERQGMGE